MKCLCLYKREQSSLWHTFYTLIQVTLGLEASDFMHWKKRLQNLQAKSLMSDVDDANFLVTIANCISPFGYQMNIIGVI
jgi:hypothetical protein